jgi:hypothetical protein
VKPGGTSSRVTAGLKPGGISSSSLSSAAEHTSGRQTLGQRDFVEAD